jgi:DNA-binding NarL/FixJ family response regulator
MLGGVVDADELRVVLGDLAPIMAIGLRAVLEENGVQVIAQEDGRTQMLEQVARLRPHAVVLDLDKDGATALAEQVQQAAPDVKVILWSRDETVMEVLESVSRSPRLVAVTAPDALWDELNSSRRSDGTKE